MFSRDIEEILQEGMAIFRGDALGMKLDAMHGAALVHHTHDRAVIRCSGDFECSRHRLSLDDEGMVTRCFEIIIEAPEDASSRVMDAAEFAMHGHRRSYDLAAVGLPDGLMAQAYAQDRKVPLGSHDEIQANAGLVGCAWSGREDESLGFQRKHVLHAQFIVAFDGHLGAQFREIMKKIVRKAVVIIDEEQQVAPVSLSQIDKLYFRPNC